MPSSIFFRSERCFRGTDPKIPTWPDYFQPCGPTPGSEPPAAELYSTNNWKQCIVPDATNRAVNNSARVEVGVNMIGLTSSKEQTPDVEDAYFFFALNAPADPEQPGDHRIHLFRTGGSWANVDPLQAPPPNDTAEEFVRVALSEDELPTEVGGSNTYRVGDAFAQALAIHHGRIQDLRYPRVAVSYRTTDDQGAGLRVAVLQHETRIASYLSPQFDDTVTNDSGPPDAVPFAVSRPLGRRTGIFAVQGWCDNPNCDRERFLYEVPLTQAAETTFLSVWTDGRDTARTTHEVFGRSFKWE